MKSRGISTVVAVVIVIVILVIAAIGGYYAIGTKGGATSVVTSVVTQGGSTVTQGGSTVTQGGSTVTNVVTSTALSTVSQTTSQAVSSNTTTGASGPHAGGTLNIGVDTQENTLDVLNSLIIPFSGTADYGIYEGLIFFGPNGNYIPGLATSWTSVNATNWIFILRQGVNFQDGTQFNASAVKFVFDRSISAPTATKTMYGLIQSTTVLNNSAVQVRLWSNSTYGYFLSRIASDYALIYSPSAFIRDGNSSTTYGLHPVGTGPYTFTEWVQNDHLTMTANPNYWGPKPYIQKVIIHIIPDPTSRLLALQSGEIQLADVPPQYASQLNTSSTLVGIGPFNRVIDMDINVNNMSNPAFQDVRVRQALNYAINRTALAAAVYYGFAQPATGGPIVPGPLYAPYYSNYSMYPAGGNITKAKQLLAAAGYSKGLNVSIDFSGTFVNSLTIATILQSQWQQAGITTNLLNKDFGLFVSDLDPCRCYQLDIHDSSGGTPFEEWLVDFVPNGGFQDLGNNNNATLISMVNQLGQTNIGNVTAYKALSNQINLLSLQDSYQIMLFYAPLIQGWSTSLHGYSIPNPQFTGYVISSGPQGVNCWLS